MYGQIKVGKNDEVDQDLLVEYQVPNMEDYTTFNAIYMSTEHVEGTWEFLKEQGE